MTSRELMEDARVISLWEETPPGMDDNRPNEEYLDSNAQDDNILRVHRVSRPELYYFPPDKAMVKSRGPAPAVIICPGGAYTIIAMEHEGPDVARAFSVRGIHAFVLKYRIPDHSLEPGLCEWPLQDVQKSISLVRSRSAEWGLDPGNIGVMGFSAGGHLTACASTMYRRSVIGETAVSLRPDFSLLIYPVMTFDENFCHGGSRKNLLGNRSDEETLIAAWSPEKHADKETPPAYLCHARDDEAVPRENSLIYRDHLTRLGILCRYDEVPAGGHGFGMKTFSPAWGWFDPMADWLEALVSDKL